MRDRLRTACRALLAVVIGLAPSATPLRAQGTRAAMVDSARVLIDAFSERQSIGMLRRALDPALGTLDASWERGAQLLGQTLLQTNQRDEAVAWMRWAIRLSPSLRVDSVNFTPAFVGLVREARAFVVASPNDSSASVRFDWSTSTPSGGFGDLRVTRGGTAGPMPLQLSVNGESLDEGRLRRLAPGSYRIAARAAGQRDVAITAEVLPGVTTIVAVNLVAAEVVLSQATERVVLSRLARVDHPQSGCTVGFFAGRPGLLVARYSRLRGASVLAVKPAEGAAAPDRVTGIAASDSVADLAVLATAVTGVDSLPVAAGVRAGTPLWSAHFPSCADTPMLSRVAVTSLTSDSLSLSQDVPGADQLGVLVDSTGAVTGFLTGPRSARTLGSVAALLASARTSMALAATSTATVVTRPEAPTAPSASVPAPKKRRSKLLPIVGGVVAAGLVGVLAMPKGSSSEPPTTGRPPTGTIVIVLP